LDKEQIELSIMPSFQTLALAFAIAPSLVSAALFPSDSLVKVIDAKNFKKAMKANVGPVIFPVLEEGC
jgi:hypothetical protein